MNSVSGVSRKRWLPLLAVASACLAAAQSQSGNASQDPANGDQAAPEVLNRGPIHEAFANPITYDPTPGPVVPNQPSDPIEEQPPDQKPEGDNVQWISGYWAWDDERTDFIWISGIWREPPPNCQWKPGYWDQCEGGWRWTCGCWTPVDDDSSQYLPAPPPSVEQGPNSTAPSENCSWTPGYWSWHEATETASARYVWSPGCWMTYNPDWLWVPPRYVPTASGYLFVRGYWDYPLERRGILYAPIYCARIRQPNFVYCPSVCVSATTITSCLFVRPRCQSYCFGDYFDTRYSSSGIFPWYSFHNSRYGCDPIYAHCAQSHYGDREWSRRLHEEYRYRSEHPSSRPPRTYAESSRISAGASGWFSNLALTMPIHQLTTHQKTPMRITQVSASQRKTFAESGKALHQIATGRRAAELAAAKHPQGNSTQPVHVKTPWSPVASRSGSGGNVRQHPLAGGRENHIPAGRAQPAAGGRENHIVQRPVLPAQHPNAQTTGKMPPAHPSYPKADHSVKVPPSHYTSNRPEPHHGLPPSEHRNSGSAPAGNPHAAQGQPRASAVSQHSAGAAPRTGARRR
jgi:hypothetical protein